MTRKTKLLGIAFLLLLGSFVFFLLYNFGPIQRFIYQQRIHAFVSTTATIQNSAQADSSRNSNISDQKRIFVNWDELKRENPDVFAWLQVSGSCINLPVLTEPEGFPGFYLSHNFWKEKDAWGSAYTLSSSNTDYATLIFAHHISNSQEMFSELAHCWSNKNKASSYLGFFDLQRSLLVEANSQSKELYPLCALHLREDGSLLSTLPTNKTAFHDWLKAMLQEPGLKSDMSQELLSLAKEAVVLITCSEDIPDQPWRCGVIFVCL